MRVDVFFTAREVGPGDVAGRVVAVLDVLRASSSIAAALANGARAVVPGETSEAIVARAKAFEKHDIRLAGERRMRKIEGFDLGNSPLEFTADVRPTLYFGSIDNFFFGGQGAIRYWF